MLSELQIAIKDILSKATTPLNAEEVTYKLAEHERVFTRQHVKRQLNQLTYSKEVEFAGKEGKTQYYTIPGQVNEPWGATAVNPATVVPQIKINGQVFSPDTLARQFIHGQWSMLNEVSNRQLSALLSLSILGNASYETLRLHSIKPVADIRRSLEAELRKINLLSDMISAVLDNQHVKTGAIGGSISNETRDSVLTELEDWIQDLSANKRSDVK